MFLQLIVLFVSPVICCVRVHDCHVAYTLCGGAGLSYELMLKRFLTEEQGVATTCHYRLLLMLARNGAMFSKLGGLEYLIDKMMAVRRANGRMLTETSSQACILQKLHRLLATPC